VEGLASAGWSGSKGIDWKNWLKGWLRKGWLEELDSNNNWLNSKGMDWKNCIRILAGWIRKRSSGRIGFE
jgi:hypothetical protein